MAELFLEEIYQYARTISKLRHIVDIIREHDEHNALMELNNCIRDIQNLCRACVESHYEEATELCNQVLTINDIQSDLILLGDVIENTIIPIMERWIQSLGTISQQINDEYILNSTACGFLTIKNLRINKYLHSNNNPLEEARKMVQKFYEPEKNKYSVFGCGLGYHIYALYLISNGSITINVYDTDCEIVEYAKMYGILDWIPKEKLKVTVCDSIEPFWDSINNDETEILFHLPSLYQMKNKVQREGLFRIYINLNTTCRLDKDTRINFWRNIAAGLPDISKIENKKINKEIVVVAAGPSLDDNMQLLRSWKNHKTIVAVGTVFKKLIQNNIRPDYVIIIDPQKRTLKQLEGIENENIPLILSMTAYWEFAVKYRGPKYMVCTSGNRKFIQDYARQHNLVKWSSGGTVASAALEFAIYFKPMKIYLVGLDLAYPEDMSHALDTMDYQKKNTKDMPLIEGVGGKQVKSDNIFINYRKAIENRICETKDILYYNMSSRGARIKGTIEPI